MQKISHFSHKNIFSPHSQITNELTLDMTCRFMHEKFESGYEALDQSKNVSIKVLRVPPNTIFYKGVILSKRGYTVDTIPRLEDTKPLHLQDNIGGFYASGKEAMMYAWGSSDNEFLVNPITSILKLRSMEKLNLIDVGDKSSVYAILEMVQMFSYDEYFLTKEGDYFRRFIVRPESENEYIESGGFSEQEYYKKRHLKQFILSAELNEDEFYMIYLENALSEVKMKGDLRKEFQIKTNLEFIKKYIIPVLENKYQELLTTLSTMEEEQKPVRKFSEKDPLTNKPTKQLQISHIHDGYIPLARATLKLQTDIDPIEVKLMNQTQVKENYILEAQKGFYDRKWGTKRFDLRNNLKVLQKNTSPEKIDDNWRRAWHYCQYALYKAIWEAFYSNEYTSPEQEPTTDKFKPNAQNVNEYLIETHPKYVDKTLRTSNYTDDYLADSFMADVLVPIFMPNIDGWIYVSTSELCTEEKSTRTDHEWWKEDNDTAPKFHSEINIFSQSRHKMIYMGLSLENPQSTSSLSTIKFQTECK